MAIALISTENMGYADWLEWQRKDIGGSDAPVICDINRYLYSVELWMDKTGQLLCDKAGEAAYWGTQIESLVRNKFTKHTGIHVNISNNLLQSEDHPYMLANLYGICEHSNYGTCVFESKTASVYKAGECDKQILDQYMLQIQHYMSVTGCMVAYIAVLIGGNRFKWKFI